MNSLDSERFREQWEQLNCMVGLMKTEYVKEDLSYEEVEITPYDLSENSY